MKGLEVADLRPKWAFERNPMAYDDSLTNQVNPLDVIPAFLGAYCAGMANKASVESVKKALLNEPIPNHSANPTIAWMLGSLRVPDGMTLFYEGGISLGRIADHLRLNEVGRADLIKWLNQLAEPEGY